MTLLKYIIAGEILAGLILFNQRFFQDYILAILLVFAYLVTLAWGWGRALQIREIFWQLIHGVPLALSILIILGSLTYYFYRIDDWVVGIFLIVLPVSIGFGNKLMKNQSIEATPTAAAARLGPKGWLSLLIFGALTGQCFRLLLIASSSSALRSPFQTLNPDFFLYYFLAALSLLTLIKISTAKDIRFSKIAVFASIIFFFLSFAVALIIYQVGFGFDPFIHQATEKLIFEQGQVTPKPVYYLGQYFLVVFLSKISLWPIGIIDSHLVPLLAAMLIPALLFFSLKNWNSKETIKLSLLTPLFLILPFSNFTLTAPQGLANLFLLITLINSINNQYPWWGLLFSALASLLIHPLAGIPAIVFVLILWASRWSARGGLAHKIVWLELLAITSFVLPLVFMLQSLISKDLAPTFGAAGLTGLRQALAWLKPNFQRQFDWVYDIGYFWNQNLYLLLTLLAVIGIVLTIKSQNWQKLKPYFWTFVILIINYIFLSNWVNFEFLIEYERANYAQRILEISFYFLLPFVFVFYRQTFEKRESAPAQVSYVPSTPKKVFGLLFFSFLILNSLYFSYPRHNQVETGHNISTSSSDVRAVQWIESVAQADYLVLANQSVSAAALKELGFKKYYPTEQGEIFFYPIPTGGPLYQFYLSMVYDRPSREIVHQAADLVGVKEGYFIINQYWFGYERIVETAKAESDDWWPIDNSIHVFQYKF